MGNSVEYLIGLPMRSVLEELGLYSEYREFCDGLLPKDKETPPAFEPWLPGLEGEGAIIECYGDMTALFTDVRTAYYDEARNSSIPEHALPRLNTIEQYLRRRFPGATIIRTDSRVLEDWLSDQQRLGRRESDWTAATDTMKNVEVWLRDTYPNQEFWTRIQ